MFRIQNQSFLTTKHRWIHAVHIIHLHHILHTTALFRKGHHSSNFFIFQILNLHFQFVILQCISEYFCKSLGSLLVSSFLSTQFFCKICINSLKLDSLILLLQMGNKSAVNIVFQNNSILLCLTEHVNILTLLNLICYIEDSSLLRLFLVFRAVLFLLFCGFNSLFCLSLIFWFPVLFDAIFQSQIFAINVLEEDIIIHLI